MQDYLRLQSKLSSSPKTWLITGVAGFIGSNLLETLLLLNQRVVGLDNLATGHRENLEEVKKLVSIGQWSNFRFVEGDIRNLEDCRQVMTFKLAEDGTSSERGGYNVDYVLHEAALGSVPRSLRDPITTNSSNIDGFLNILEASKDAGVTRFVYAASSSTYGDHPVLPKVEVNIGNPLSPYAVTKLVNELYADVFSRCYDFHTVGLRYFNVFGKRQDPNGAYAAVIPKWTSSLLEGKDVYINGDGETSRDFCFIDNVVQANLLAATVKNPEAVNQVYNVAVGERTTLKELYKLIEASLASEGQFSDSKLIYRDFRSGDVRHSLADVSKARRLLGYEPAANVRDGIRFAMPWYVKILGDK